MDRKIDSGNDGYGLFIDDCRNIVDTLSDEFNSEVPIDLTITSPPYTDVKNYEADEETQIGFGQSYEDYLDDLRDVFSQVYQLTSDDGMLWVVVNTVKKDQRVVQLPFDIADVCENLPDRSVCDECGTRVVKDKETGEKECPSCSAMYDPLTDSWKLQDIIVWDKNRARPWSRKGQLRNVYEYVLCFSKSDENLTFDIDSIRIPDTDELEDWWVKYPERYNPRGKVPNNIWDYTTPTQGSWGRGDIDHPAPFPTGLVERIVSLSSSPGDTVFDPFAGTGSVLKVSEAMGRNPLGFELSEEYAQMYSETRSDFIEEWNSESQTQTQRDLEKAICKLRQMKYPREITRRIRKETGAESLSELGINTLIQMSREIVDRDKYDDENTLMGADLYVVFDKSTSEDQQREVMEAAQKCSNEPPCSKFGVECRLTPVVLSEVGNVDELSSTDLYLYSDDTYNQYQGLITVEELVQHAGDEDVWREQNAKNEYPPIVSNLQVDIQDPRNSEGSISLTDTKPTEHSDEENTRISDFS